MAEFKLGRLRFVWQGPWATGTNYVKDDIVSYGAKSYVCKVGHTANTLFYTDLNNATARWSLMSDGIAWAGTWTKNTVYKLNDIIKIGAKDYICKLGHTSTNVDYTGFYTDLSANWTLLVDGTQWRSTWATTTFYYIGDIVRFGAKEYICTTAHSSNAVANSGFYSDNANWQLFSDGITWKNTWATSTFYKIGDIVKFGAKDYICSVGHTSSGTVNSGFYGDAANWQLLVDGMQWQNTWTTNNFYKIGDVIKYGAKDYICTTGHTSSVTLNGGFYTDLTAGNWQLMNDGIQWISAGWTTATYYKIGDIVKYGGIVYICNTGHLSLTTLEATVGNWDVVTKGFNWISAGWTTGTDYHLNDIVKYGADLYLCSTPHTSSGSTINLSNFSLFVPGLEYTNSYNPSTSYILGDVTTYGGYVYVSKSTNNIGHTPSTETTYWDVVTTGFNTRGAWSAGASPTYRTGDVITYGAYVYVALLDNANTNPSVDTTSWSLLNTGIFWKGAWATSTAYKLGDAVGYASSSYICILAHSSTTGTRPDNDISGTYWNSLSQGAATNVTTTRGDMIYYSASGNARLPIGTDGQVLKVVGSDPVWATYGVVSDVYYVSINGTDGAGYGVSIDKPWKTIAYACAQIASGPANPNAQFLLNANKSFMAAEVTNYLSYTYKVSVTGTASSAFTTTNTSGLTVGMPIRFSSLTGALQLSGVALNTTTTYYVSAITTNTSFTLAATYLGTAGPASGTGTTTGNYYYDSAVTVRDAGYVIDAAIFDLGRGGNVESTITAQLYYSGQTTYASTNVLQQKAQFVAALNYLSTISANILANTAPASNYQTLNSVGSPVTQTINGSYTAEAGTSTKAQALITLVSDAVNAGTTLSIPTSTKPNTTLYIKTGTYSEILPISVPAFTSLVGDELRTVVVQPFTIAATASSSSGTSLTVTSNSGIVNGMGIYGHTSIPDGTTVTNSSTNTLTLSQATTGNVTGPITIGYSMTNMFYMRDGTGARNMTVKNLFGGLTTANGYGTKRPTSGAFFSLDPGTGTTDERVWISTRSPYVQNVSLFGTGCVGCKIDGSLHGGGNKSMTLNDFTNILSDGIAVWCTNLAKVEAVSVFSYYGYAGYLSETGGAIRATNGNSSYGTYGCVAEAGSPTEVPITGTVNTRSSQALVSNVLLGGGQVLWLEYSNAGQNYTTASTSIFSGSGVGAVVSAPSIYSNAITEVRIITGGANYASAVNNAQTGTSTVLTLSAADAANTATYNGMRVVLTDGTGAGQYGVIAGYNGATKNANIYKESFTPLTVSSSTTTVFNVSNTSTIPVGSPILFTGTTFGGVTTQTQIYYVVAANFTATTFSIATSLGGTAITLSAASGTMTVQLAGWDVAVSGTSVVTNLDFTSRYIIEPRVTFTGGGGTGALVRAKVLSGVITEFRIINPGTGFVSTPTIVITDPNATSQANVTVRRQTTGVLGQPTWTSRGSSYKDATVSISGDGYADIQPVGYFINLTGLQSVPVAGSNLVFQGNGIYYTLVQVIAPILGGPGNYGAYVQINPGFSTVNAPSHGDTVTATIQYSQVRLTGHDFLYVGSGNFGATGYPNKFSTANLVQLNETINSAGGRVFFTSTDQDGNFRVGGLFTVQQATGVATLNANLFNLSGLNALQFASGGASVVQFTTDATFSANSDSVVPTQRAIKAFLASQLGAGGAVLAVSSLTSGNVIINANQITTQNSVDLAITATAGRTIQLNTTTNLNSITTITSGGSLVTTSGSVITVASGSSATFASGSTLTVNGTGTITAVPSAGTDITNKKYVDRALSLNTMWTNAW
jgi:hypothetical protein